MNKEYRTTSLNIASILLTKKIELLRHVNKKKQFTFVFNNRTDIEGIITNYINGNLELNIKDFLDNKTVLANIIKS